ncbi:hypothetical protein [Planosporangium thailandense]|uniref:hypothetical protein n=1 Tax=Planosporangium thailandense TaxID=765197 RepID=UPI003B83A55C
MKLGYILSCEENGPADLIERARAAERAGVEGLWISGHVHPWLEEQGQCPFVWSMISALSQVCSLPITTAVTCPSMRIHLAIAAQAAATGYAGALVGWARATLRLTVTVVHKLAGQIGFQVLPRRWVVERTLAWINRCRRTVRDYERRPDHHAAMVQWTMIIIMTRRLPASANHPPDRPEQPEPVISQALRRPTGRHTRYPLGCRHLQRHSVTASHIRPIRTVSGPHQLARCTSQEAQLTAQPHRSIDSSLSTTRPTSHTAAADAQGVGRLFMPDKATGSLIPLSQGDRSWLRHPRHADPPTPHPDQPAARLPTTRCSTPPAEAAQRVRVRESWLRRKATARGAVHVPGQAPALLPHRPRRDRRRLRPSRGRPAWPAKDPAHGPGSRLATRPPAKRPCTHRRPHIEWEQPMAWVERRGNSFRVRYRNSHGRW